MPEDEKPPIKLEKFRDAVLAICEAANPNKMKQIADFVAGGTTGLDDESVAMLLALLDHKNDFCGWRRLGKLARWELVEGTEDQWHTSPEWAEVPEWA